MNVYYITHLLARAPDLREYLLAAHNPSPFPNEIHQELELTGCQFHRLSPAQYGACLWLDGEVIKRKQGRFFAYRAARQRADARQQLLKLEGFSEKIIRSQVKSCTLSSIVSRAVSTRIGLTTPVERR